MLHGRLVAVRALGALEGDDQRRAVGAGACSHVVLPPDRVVEDLAEDAADERRVEAEPLAEGRAGAAAAPFRGRRRAPEAVAVGLGAGDLRAPGAPARPGR